MIVVANKIASSTRNISLPKEIIINEEIISKEGYLIAVRAIEKKNVYGELELVDGRITKILKDDIIIGVLGERRALKGFKGTVPDSLKVGDIVNILNLGGIVGKCTSYNPNFGEPLKVEVLGAVVNNNIPINIKINSVQWKDTIGKLCPIILVTGTCMDTGKTTVACEIINGLKNKNKRVVAAKLSGVACIKDINRMLDYGATSSLIFTDAGLPSTVNACNVVQASKGILTKLQEYNPDVMVIELGDGILGSYHVLDILKDQEIINSVSLIIFCANDPVGVYGGKKIYEDLNLKIGVVSGPVTDNDVGIEYVEKELGIPAYNAIYDSQNLVNFIFTELQNGYH